MDVPAAESDSLIASNSPQNYSGDDTSNTTTRATSTSSPASNQTTSNMAFILYSSAFLGALLFSGTVWYIMWNVNYFFFVWHPTFMALTIFMVTNGILVLQQATTREERNSSLNLHRLIQTISILSVISGFYVIFTFKNMNKHGHFTSPHGIAGLTTITLLMIQLIGGAVLLNFPGLFGGVNKARSFYKYHRMSGYFILFLIYLTAMGGTQADWTKMQFDHLWIWFVAIGLVFVGIIGRIKTNKLKRN